MLFQHFSRTQYLSRLSQSRTQTHPVTHWNKTFLKSKKVMSEKMDDCGQGTNLYNARILFMKHTLWLASWVLMRSWATAILSLVTVPFFCIGPCPPAISIFTLASQRQHWRAERHLKSKQMSNVNSLESEFTQWTIGPYEKQVRRNGVGTEAVGGEMSPHNVALLLERLVIRQNTEAFSICI